uniref:Putative zn finger n=1 Tax=Panstrongylus lignarius TaxID=156445 RepID=A0A224XGV0_9HEMI
MDGMINDDFFTLPLVLEAPDVSQSINMINCNGWQFEVAKDQPLVILDNGNLALQNMSDSLLLSTGSCQNRIDSPQNIEPKVENSEIEDVATKNKVEEMTLNLGSNEDLMNELVETLVMYKCKLCPFKTSEKNSLSTHLESIHLKNVKKEDVVVNVGLKLEDSAGHNSTVKEEQMVYVCGNCSEAFATYGECRIHMALIHKIMMGNIKSEDMRAELFNTNFIKSQVKLEENSIVSNIKVVPSKKSQLTKCHEKKLKYVCPLSGCQVKLSSREFLEKHKLCHTPDSQDFTCIACSLSFPKWIRCAHHLWKSHSVDVDLYACSNCSYKTPYKMKLTEHCMIHSSNKNFTCNVCGKNFKQGSQLRNHEVSHLKGGENEDKLPNWIRRRECDQCGKTFCDSKALKKHVKAVHSKLKPYSCQVCGHCSATKNMLRIHLRQHSGDKPFACPACSYSTGDHNSLRRHWMRHTGVRPYRCPHCPYSAIQSCSLKSHLFRQHPGLPGVFSCNQCTFVSVSETALHHHIRTHTTKIRKNDDNGSDHSIHNNNSVHFNGANNVNVSAVSTVDEDDESNHFFENEPMVTDTGGITIPADQPCLTTSILNI